MEAANNSVDLDLVDKIHNDDLEFRDYFKWESDWKQRRNKVANWLNKEMIEKIIFKLRSVIWKINFLIIKVDISDTQTYNSLIRLEAVLREYENIDDDYDDVQTLLRFLWEIFTWYDWVEWLYDKDAKYSNKDIIKNIILKV